MELNKFSPFRTTRNMQSQIQEFPDAVSLAILAYQEGMIAYLKEAVGDRTKRQKNNIRRGIKYISHEIIDF
jgi:hypothetical protein